MSSSVDNYSSSGTENDDPYDLTYNDEAQELLNDAIASNNRNRKLNQRLRSASSASKKAGSKRKSTLLSEESSLVSSNDSKRNADEAKVTPKASTTNKRPGRKPLEKSAETPLDPKQKRKEQNRAAQRAFRERKERHVQELQERIRQLEEANAAHSDLIKENNLLKEQVKKLQEENYALKGTQFTFQYPLHDDMILGNGSSGSTDKSHYSLSSNSSIKSSSSSSEHNSPQSNPQDGGFNVTPQSDQSIEGLFAPPQTTDFLTQSLPVNDVKAPVYNFTDYRVPPSSADSLLLHNDTLPPLFGADVDLFGLSAPAPLNDTLETMEPPSCKTQVLETLRQVKGQPVRASDLQQRVQTYCPDFSLDQLCDDLKKKARCTQEVLTDKEVDCIINYIEQKKH